MIIIKYFLLGLFTALLFPPFFVLPLGFVIFPYFYNQILKLKLYNSIILFFFSGFLYALAFFSIFLIWVQNPFYVFEETKNYSFLSFLLIILISFIFGLFFILFKYINNSKYLYFFIPLIFVTFEIFISNFLYGFPWFSLALIISSNKIGSILLYLFGSHMTGLLLVIIFLIPQIIRDKNILFKFNKKIALIFIIVCIILIYLNFREDSTQIKKINIDLVQTNHSYLKNNYISNEEKYNEIVSIIKKSNADLIIFGENNFPYLATNLNRIDLGNYLKNNKQAIIIGATRKENNNYYNSMLLIQKNNIQYFDKKILVPFGEFVPMRRYIKFIEKISGTNDFSKGNQNRIIKINNEYSIIPVICYEIIFFWRLLTKQNNYGDIIVNITNDSWFGNLIGPYQHFYLTKMRASELNKTLLRVSTNGISGIVNNDGSVLYNTKLNQKKILSTNINIFNNNNLVFLHKIYKYILLLFFIIILYLSFFKNND